MGGAEGISWTVLLWAGLCSNATLLAGVSNHLVAKHLCTTFTASAWLLSVFIYFTKTGCIKVEAPPKLVCLVTYFGCIVFAFTAVVMACIQDFDDGEEEHNGILIWASIECTLVTVCYLHIIFFKQFGETCCNYCCDLIASKSETEPEEPEEVKIVEKVTEGDIALVKADIDRGSNKSSSFSHITTPQNEDTTDDDDEVQEKEELPKDKPSEDDDAVAVEKKESEEK